MSRSNKTDVNQMTSRIESDTPLVPGAVARAVLEEAGVWLGQPLPRSWARELTARANTVYARNARFRKKIREPGPAGRDHLWMFMRHWLCGVLWERRPHLHARLPSDYCVGRPLPPKPFAAPRRRLKAGQKIPSSKTPRPRATPNYAL